MDFPYTKPTDDRFSFISGLAVIAATVLAMCSALLV